MTPDVFLAEIVQPNMQLALEEPGNLRAIVNAVLTIDALAGVIHAHASATGSATVAAYADDLFRDELANISSSYRILRDAAASIKHGELSPKRKKVRFVTEAKAIRSVRNQCGLFQCGDALGGSVIVIEFDPGPGFVRATNVVADSFRMLNRVVRGEAPRVDEYDLVHPEK